ncbi:DUF4278 domain-containing protein [Leptolyngbya sp. FACHB-36]|uniref:arginine synthesis PII-interacting regulator PirA n=1 Tax=Leptolyngbya sp. FACHB-36 TaxID=2692808 RepID=UPI00167FFBDD|nr:DUF4278 domain-containing protein [Leptolyngbya sp. FACHB-36]MBD2019652.1 DUF4278 domain-containing protein [Leptolyngbya sp. FACHB-36]
MKLLYRGVGYDYDPQAVRSDRPWNRVRAARAGYTLTYRGVSYSIDPNQEVPDHSAMPVAQLTYRGVAYGLNGWTPAAVAETVAPRAARSRSEVAAAHRSNLYRNVQHRLQVAQEKGDMALVRLLEQELQHIA